MYHLKVDFYLQMKEEEKPKNKNKNTLYIESLNIPIETFRELF